MPEVAIGPGLIILLPMLILIVGMMDYNDKTDTKYY